MSCLYPNCTSTKYFSKGTEITFFQFPIIPHIRERWLRACNVVEGDLPKVPYVCSLHFSSNEIALEKKHIRLSRGAVPKSFSSEMSNVPAEEEYLPTFERCKNLIQMQAGNLPQNDALEVMETEADNLEQYLRYLEGGDQYAVESQPMEDEVCMSNTLGIVEPGEKFQNYLKYLEGERKYAIELPQGGISRKVVRRNYTSVATQTEDSLDLFRLKCVELKKSNKALAKKCAEYEVKLNEAKNNHQIQISFLSPETLADISKPPRYNLDAISTATCIYSAGPRCYRLLRKMNLPLPSPSTLRRWASKLCVEPGLQVQTLAHMKSYELPLEDKLCVLSFDEMKVREEWAYDRKNDKAIPPKKKVQVAMVRGLRGSWKQPIFYDFDFAMKEETILYIISELFKIGYTVVAAVSDLGTENQALWTNMGISVQKPFFAHPCDEQKKVFVFADVPHIIKLFRNHFADHGFLYENILLKKDVIEELISICNADLNIIKTLTLEMLNVKGPERQKVKFATKLFSHTTAIALKRCASLGLCQNAEKFVECSKLFKIINDWFDIFNTKTAQKDTRPLSKAYGLAIADQNYTLQLMNNIIEDLLSFRSKNLLPFQRGVMQNNNALPLLQNYVEQNYGMKFILTSKLNQDCLENFFSAIRAKGGLHDHPSPIEFKYRLRSYVLGRNENILCSEANVQQTEDNLMKFETLGDRVEEDKDEAHAIEDEILTHHVFKEINDVPLSPEETVELEEQNETNEFLNNLSSLSDVEFDGLENFAGYIISKMGLKEFGCRTSAGNDQNFTYVNLLSEGGLYKPSAEFLSFLEQANNTFVKINGETLATGPNYMQNLLLNTRVNLNEKVLKRFYLGRTFFRIRYLNKKLKESKTSSNGKKKNSSTKQKKNSSTKQKKNSSTKKTKNSSTGKNKISSTRKNKIVFNSKKAKKMKKITT